MGFWLAFLRPLGARISDSPAKSAQNSRKNQKVATNERHYCILRLAHRGSAVFRALRRRGTRRAVVTVSPTPAPTLLHIFDASSSPATAYRRGLIPAHLASRTVCRTVTRCDVRERTASISTISCSTISRSKPTGRGAIMQRLTSWLERRRSASRSRAIRPESGAKKNRKNNNDYFIGSTSGRMDNTNSENVAVRSARNNHKDSKNNNHHFSNNKDNNGDNSYLTGFQAGVSAAAYASMRAAPPNFARGAPLYASMFADRPPASIGYVQGNGNFTIRSGSSSSSTSTISRESATAGGTGYWLRATPLTPAVVASETTPRKKIRTNPWLLSSDRNNNTLIHNRDNNNNDKNENNKNVKKCTCAADDDARRRLTRATAALSFAESMTSRVSSLSGTSGNATGPRKSASASSYSSTSSFYRIPDAGTDPTVTVFSQMLNSSTCSSGYGSQDNSPECSVHSPDWTAVSQQQRQLQHRSASGEITVTLAGSAASFGAATIDSSACARRAFADSIAAHTCDGEDHFYHELESINRYSSRSDDETLILEGAYAPIIPLNRGANTQDEPIYAVPFQRRASQNYFGTDCRTLSLSSSTESLSNSRCIQWDYDMDGKNDGDYDEIDVRLTEFIDDKNGEHENDADSNEADAEELSLASQASCASTSTSCSSWTPMLRTTGTIDPPLPSEYYQSQIWSGKNSNAYYSSDSDSDTSARELMISAAFATRQRRLLPTPPTRNSSAAVMPHAMDVNILAELDKQIIELQIQSDTVRGLVEEAKARHELRAHTRELCMQHLQELRKLRCCVMHNHFELCI